jgi:hypothetical protein
MQLCGFAVVRLCGCAVMRLGGYAVGRSGRKLKTFIYEN